MLPWGVGCSLWQAKLDLSPRFRMRGRDMGVLGMIAALTSVWRNWRKVKRKKFGAKDFERLRGGWRDVEQLAS